MIHEINISNQNFKKIVEKITQTQLINYVTIKHTTLQSNIKNKDEPILLQDVVKVSC
jgi:hypothetical protein